MNTQAAVPLAAGEFGFDRTDFAFIANTLYEDAGISLPASKANLVYSRLAKRLRALGLENFRDYCALVDSEDGADERAQMVAALTTNVTRFFREPHHFQHLRSKLIEPMAKELRDGRRLRIWSAGCSSGQEPYSIALSILSCSRLVARPPIPPRKRQAFPPIFAAAGWRAREPAPCDSTRRRAASSPSASSTSLGPGR